ncbi:MAG: hypothetical protein HY323_03470 [Betaproteobacteria bacterium]|nr:hypothetical protein [Betaproteobacteria bacterium]
MPTQDQIVARIKKKQQELLNFEPEVLIYYLDFDHVRELLQVTTLTREKWQEEVGYRTPLAEARTYMAEYGWPKTLGHRGISAERTIQKMAAWAFLADDQEALRITEETDYAQYGAPILWALCLHWGFDVPGDAAVTRMASGRACRPGCEEGCGQ